MFLINKLWIKYFCKEIGIDQFGNKYYIGKGKNYLGINKRYVIYKGMDESSKVPPRWHAWLHYLNDEIPEGEELERYEWQKDHLPNLSGTKHAYTPAISNDIGLKTYSNWTPTDNLGDNER